MIAWRSRFRNLMMWALIYGSVLFITGWVTMTLLVRSSSTIPCPSVESKTLIEALELAEKSGIRIHVDRLKINDEVLPNTILKQSPTAGTAIKERSVIGVTVSAARNQKRIPDVRGFPKDLAVQTLKDFGIDDVRLIETQRLDVKDVVIAQDPPTVMSGPKTKTVGLLFSSGSIRYEYVMPNLKGRRFEEVTRSMELEGIRIKAVRYVVSDQTEPDAVLDHDPPAGYLLNAEEGVTFTVNRKPPTDSNTEGKLLRFIPYQVKPGLFTKQVFFSPELDGRYFLPLLVARAEPSEMIFFPVVLDPEKPSRLLRYRVEEYIYF